MEVVLKELTLVMVALLGWLNIHMKISGVDHLETGFQVITVQDEFIGNKSLFKNVYLK